MDETALREKIGQLMSEVRHLPTADDSIQTGPARGGSGRSSSRGREMAALEDNLDHLRLAIKYMVFDLEATKRENHLLRDMLGGA